MGRRGYTPFVDAVEATPSQFAQAADLLAEARSEAERIIAAAERRADLLLADADRRAAAQRSAASIFLQKARAVLEIAQQRAALAPPEIDLTGRSRADDEPSAVSDAPLPGELDRLLADAVASAVATSVAATQNRFIGR